jgi:two-component system, chemotaxis family, protein-glutamate methylesterase/glutaminase
MRLEKLRVLVADGNVVSRKQITDAVNATEYGMVLHTAPNLQIAVEWLKQSEIDLLLLDIDLVREEGIGFVRSVKSQYPHIPVILTSDKSPMNAALTLEAIGAGALDFILKAGSSDIRLWQNKTKSELDTIFLQTKISHYLPNNAGTTDRSSSNSDNKEQKKEPTILKSSMKPSRFDLVVIASSTGGPIALDVICSQLPSSLGKPVLVVQHMPPGFTNILAATLDKKYAPTVVEAKEGDLVQVGIMAIAPGGYHMVVGVPDEKGKKLQLTEAPFVNGVRPAADVLFESVAKVYKGMNILAVVLTGMGNDGTKGIREMKAHCNCYCLTQSEDSCVVYGMPKCVVQAGLSDEVVELKNLATRITQLTRGGG